jgi:streptogramin lyase
MMKRLSLFGIAVALVCSCGGAWGESVSGVVKDASGTPLRGVMVTAIKDNFKKTVSVLSQADGTFTIDGLSAMDYDIRARYIGLEDNTITGITAGSSKSVTLSMEPVENIDLQRPADNLLSLLKFDSDKDKANFKMFCTYCHQVGSIGFRSPEEPVDWETMVTRMDGYGGLYKHSQETIVPRLLAAYSDEAMKSWPEYTGPPAPEDSVLAVRITEWDVGKRGKTVGPLGNDSSLYREPGGTFMHDMELGRNGLVYGVDGANDAVVEFNPETEELIWYVMPGYATVDQSKPRSAIHSIEAGPKGNMWLTLAGSGEMGVFDITTKEFVTMSGAPAPAPRGGYPHTLRVDQNTGLIWYTDAAREVCSMNPNPPYEVTEYKTLSADQAVGGGRGEASGRTPYGLDIAPDGMIWYAKLNGNRIGRINPNVEGGDIKEWNPPFIGPRRLQLDQHGIVWVPGWGSGVIGRFDPKTEEWKVYEMPNAINRLPYALNINRKNGDIWITGTGSDTLIKLDPETGHFTDYRLPSRVTFMREIEIDDDGNIWTTNSNGPLRHTERGVTSFIKLEPGI